MSRRARTAEEVLDTYISTAPRDALVRLQSEVSAALKYRVFDEEKQPGLEWTRTAPQAHEVSK